MWIQYLRSYKVGGVPLWVIGACGLAGVLVDVDHLFSYWITGQASRVAHTPLAIIAGVIICGIVACSGGLYYRLVLKKKRLKQSK